MKLYLRFAHNQLMKRMSSYLLVWVVLSKMNLLAERILGADLEALCYLIVDWGRALYA